jgi:hypothetical protein
MATSLVVLAVYAGAGLILKAPPWRRAADAG